MAVRAKDHPVADIVGAAGHSLTRARLLGAQPVEVIPGAIAGEVAVLERQGGTVGARGEAVHSRVEQVGEHRRVVEDRVLAGDVIEV